METKEIKLLSSYSEKSSYEKQREDALRSKERVTYTIYIDCCYRSTAEARYWDFVTNILEYTNAFYVGGKENTVLLPNLCYGYKLEITFTYPSCDYRTEYIAKGEKIYKLYTSKRDTLYDQAHDKNRMKEKVRNGQWTTKYKTHESEEYVKNGFNHIDERTTPVEA